MTTGKRLDDVVLGLTVRERVLLAIRPWLAGEEPADGLARNCPEPDRPEMERLFHAIERGNQLLGEAVALSLEWANTEDVTMAWLENASPPSSPVRECATRADVGCQPFPLRAAASCATCR